MSKLSAITMILGALLTLPIEYLFLQTHGPYEQALNQIVWGLNDHDYSRWAVFPALLILPGLRAFHLLQQDQYGKTGLWGYRMSFGGVVLATFGQIWDYVLFDPWGHPMHGVGFMMQLLGILLMTFGFPLWATANFGSLRGWQRLIPILWVLYIFGIWFSIFVEDESWLYPRFGIDGNFLADGVQSFAYILMGIILWTKGEYT